MEAEAQAGDLEYELADSLRAAAEAKLGPRDLAGEEWGRLRWLAGDLRKLWESFPKNGERQELTGEQYLARTAAVGKCRLRYLRRDSNAGVDAWRFEFTGSPMAFDNARAAIKTLVPRDCWLFDGERRCWLVAVECEAVLAGLFVNFTAEKRALLEQGSLFEEQQGPG